MVLEEANSDQEPSPSFSEPQPTSDIDPYASGNSNPNYTTTTDSNYIRLQQPNAAPIYINLANTPGGIQKGREAQIHHHHALSRELQAMADRVNPIIKRPITQQEAEAYLHYSAKTRQIASWGPTVGISIAAIQAYRTTNKGFRFPFWSPMKEGSRLSLDKFGPLRGQMARLTWHTTRLSVWFIAGNLLGGLLFATYGISQAMAGRSMDPRLRDIKEAMLTLAKERRTQSVPKQQNEGEGAKPGETYEMARQRRSVQKQVPVQRSKQQDDDMSPTGGAFQEDIRQSEADTGLMDDGQVRSYEYNRHQEQVRADAEANYNNTSRPPTQQQQQPQRGASRPSASPSQSEQSQSKSSGSSWDRLRHDAMSSNQNQPSNQRSARPAPSAQSASSGDESFNFSRSDEDGQLAKSEAQKDFDARIERERAGKDFNDSNRGGRW